MDIGPYVCIYIYVYVYVYVYVCAWAVQSWAGAIYRDPTLFSFDSCVRIFQGTFGLRDHG